MTREEKSQYIEDLATKLSETGVFYVTDTAGLNVETVNQLRERCYKGNIELKVVKNSLLKKALEKVEGRNYEDLYGVLAGPTAVMFSEVGNAPAKLIKDFRKKFDKPLLKGAYIEEAIYTGDENLDFLTALKSKEELIGEIISLLQSPAKNVVSGLKSGGSTIAGLLKTLSERTEA
ncbi:MAG: 50S ribosomal protein L10 [Crocinitomicaceae bacterium]|nr:50S ribosomal protein L10 [Crocinitomicaceae bacterium]